MGVLIGSQMETYTRRLLRDIDDGSGVTIYSSQDYLDAHNAAYHWWCRRFSYSPSDVTAFTISFAAGTANASASAIASPNRIVRGLVTYNAALVACQRVPMDEVVQKQIEQPTHGVPSKWAIEGKRGAFGTFIGALWPIPDQASNIDVRAMLVEADITSGTAPNVNDSECRSLCHLGALILLPPLVRPDSVTQGIAALLSDAIKAALGTKQSILNPNLEHYEAAS